MSFKWILVLLLFPAITWASELCVEQLKGTCRGTCGPSEVSEAGAFIDCSGSEKCCVASDAGKQSATSVKVIRIEDYSFSPAEIKIGKGTEVVWKNSDSVEHTVTASDGSFDSGTLAPKGEYKKRFDKSGRYPYTCDMHPGMAGIIVVE